MINKKKTIIYLIILLFFMQFIINYGLFFYNKKYKINFNIKNFIEKTFSLENNIITYYERDVLNNDSSLKNIVVIHSPFESSFNSNYMLSNIFNIFNDSTNNFKIILIDLPAHGKSFKQNNYDYSFRNISSCILKLLENLNINDIYLICDKLSSNIGLNMISLNDKIFLNTILIDPVFNYNCYLENIKLSMKNKFLTLSSFIFLNLKNSELYLNNYVISYFNNKNSSNKHVKKMISESTPISIKDVSSKNINVFALVTNKKYFKSSYLKNLSNNFSVIFFLPHKNLVEQIIKK